MSDFRSTMMEEGAILAEGAVIERLRRAGAPISRHVLASSLVLEEEGREALREIYRSYIDVSAEYFLPIAVLAPTWKAGAGQSERAGLDMKSLNTRCVRFMRDVAAEYPRREGRIFIGGLVGSRGDAYRPEEGLPRETARRYHAPQIEALADAGVDFILASTLPSVEEAAGISLAASDSGSTLVTSYVARNDGRVLDGTALSEAVETIDGIGGEPPLFHMVNCVHPVNFVMALGRDFNAPLAESGRMAGLQANASRLDPEDLEGRGELDAEDPVRWAGAMALLNGNHGIRLLGGCCGTDESHIRSLARVLTDNR